MMKTKYSRTYFFADSIDSRLDSRHIIYNVSIGVFLSAGFFQPRLYSPFFPLDLSFDPIRTFFITSKITQRFSIQEYPLYQWLRKETIDRFWAYRKNSDEDGSLHDVSMWSERVDEEMKLRNWLKEPPGKNITALAIVRE